MLVCLKSFKNRFRSVRKTNTGWQFSFSFTQFNLQNKFFGDFSTWITVIILHTIPVVILDKFNIHIDTPPNSLLSVSWLIPSSDPSYYRTTYLCISISLELWLQQSLAVTRPYHCFTFSHHSLICTALHTQIKSHI